MIRREQCNERRRRGHENQGNVASRSLADKCRKEKRDYSVAKNEGASWDMSIWWAFFVKHKHKRRRRRRTASSCRTTIFKDYVGMAHKNTMIMMVAMMVVVIVIDGR